MWLELNCQCFLNPLTVGNSRNLFGSFSLARLPGVFLVHAWLQAQPQMCSFTQNIWAPSPVLLSWIPPHFLSTLVTLNLVLLFFKPIDFGVSQQAAGFLFFSFFKFGFIRS